MAETVKKSRIVSDEDNLEESLMEEFNQRLKSCMVQEINIHGITTNEFIEIERENYYETVETTTHISNGQKTSNGFSHNTEVENCTQKTVDNMSEEQAVVKPDILENLYERIDDENIYENVEPNVEVTAEVEKEIPTVGIDNTDASPVKPTLTLPSTLLTASESLDFDNPDLKSVKDRMFLSTDDTSCLLFTQTVTSPMLTPSEENIDFLKGFRRQSSQNTGSEPTSSSSKTDGQVENEEVFDNSSGSDKIEGNTNNTEAIYENLQGPHTNIYENVSELKQQQQEDLIKCDSEKFIQQEALYANLTEVKEAPKASQSEIESFDNDETNQQDLLESEVVDVQKPVVVEETVEVEQPEIVKVKHVENEEIIPDNQEVVTDEPEIIQEIQQQQVVEEEEEIIEQQKPVEIIEAIEKEKIIIEKHEPEIVCELPENHIEIETTQELQQQQEEEEIHENGFVNGNARRPLSIEIKEITEMIEEKISSPESCKLSGEVPEDIVSEKTKKFEQIIHQTEELPVVTGNKMVISPTQNIQNLKSVFMKSDNETTVTTTTTEKLEFNELKTLDVMKHIHKFENISPSKESSDELNSSTEVTSETTTTYVETIESKSSTQQDKAIKKKKSKKSRSHEKENISVSETNINKNEDCYYNVNVKNLCRSFGDLTKIGSETYHNEKNRDDLKMRTKSMTDIRALEPIRNIENVFAGVSVKALRDRFSFRSSNNPYNSSDKGQLYRKSSFNKFDALQKKNILHVRSSDSSKAQEKFNGSQIDGTNCKACDKQVFQMEQIKAEKAIWHKNCFRCTECSKQLNVDTYESHEGLLYCKPHFKSLFAPKVVEDDTQPMPRKHQLIICENQPEELPPDVARASDKPDLGLEELQNLNVKERFQVFEHYEETTNQTERNPINVKKAPSILSKLARFQAKGMDIGVTDDSLNGIPIEASESEEEEEEYDDEGEGEDAELVRARRAQREKPFHFTAMNDVKNKWEQGDNQQARDERREERKQEIQSIRNRLFMGKQGKMKEMYQQAVAEAESGANVKKSTPIEVTDTRTIKEKFEKGEALYEEHKQAQDVEDMSVFESGISKKSRSIFLELDANASKAPQISPVTTPKISSDVKKMREVFANRQTSDDVVKSSEQVDDVVIQTSDIQQRFKFFETYKEPEKQRKQFRITPPREGQVKADTPDREIYRDPDIVRAEEQVEDSIVAKERHTATKMLNKFRQMEENLNREQTPQGPKPLKRFTPPPEPARTESSSEEEYTGSEEEEEEGEDEIDQRKYTDAELLEAQKAARAKQLRAKFEKWEANELKKEQNNSSVNIHEEIGEEQCIESTKILRARFESMKGISQEVNRTPKVKVNRFVDTTKHSEICESCKQRVYPLEKISVHNIIFHKNCFKCKECNAILRMDSYSYNQGLLYCTPHFKRLFISKGNYDTAFGLEQHKEKWNTTVA